MPDQTLKADPRGRGRVPLDSDQVQARLTLIQHLYRETLTGASQALAISGQPPLTADEKEVLFGEVERAVWSFGDALFENPPASAAEWVERASDVPAVKDAITRGVTRILTNRRE